MGHRGGPGEVQERFRIITTSDLGRLRSISHSDPGDRDSGGEFNRLQFSDPIPIEFDLCTGVPIVDNNYRHSDDERHEYRIVQIIQLMEI